MDHPEINEQLRAIAEINQRPIYFPNALGFERLRIVWVILSALGLALIVATWRINDAWRDIADLKKTVTELKVTVETNKAVINAYPFPTWYEQHRAIWEMKVRGESFKESFFREHGYPAPGQPEK